MLNNQAKKDFEKWYKNRKPHTPIHTPYDVFMGKSLSEKYGIIVDWFDSVGIYIEILRTPKGYSGFVNTLSDNIWSKTRTQARQKAIEQANEIYNKRYDKSRKI